MASHTKLLILGALVLSSVGFIRAQGTVGTEESPGDDLTTLPSLPYIAEVIGADVNVRSGAGSAFYDTGKLNAPVRVTVVGHMHGWSEIIPPNGSFSWVAKEYVQLSPAMPGVGLIKGPEVRIWAGSDFREPNRSTQLQVRLNDGDMVKLVDPTDQKSDYYKIVPPHGAHLWISSRFLKYVAPLKPVLPGILEPALQPAVAPALKPKVTVEIATPPTVEPAVKPEPSVTVRPVVRPAVVQPGPAEVAPLVVEPEVKVEVKLPGAEAARVKECYDLAEKIRAELEKPLAAQNYDEFKNTLTVILNDADAGRGQRYAEYQLQQIARFELARQASDEVKKQDADLLKLREQIRESFKTRIAGIPNPGKYIIKGTLQPSLVFTGEVGKKRYKVLNDDGKVLCYAVCADGVLSLYVDRFVGRKVGLKGAIVSDKTNPIGLVTFTAIEELPALETAETANNLQAPPKP
jgi:hypothetical protein